VCIVLLAVLLAVGFQSLASNAPSTHDTWFKAWSDESTVWARGLWETWSDRRGAEMMCVDQELLPIGHTDLVENTRHVMPDRTVTDRQLISNVLV
jgi:hypothetical protein